DRSHGRATELHHDDGHGPAAPWSRRLRVYRPLPCGSVNPTNVRARNACPTGRVGPPRPRSPAIAAGIGRSAGSSRPSPARPVPAAPRQTAPGVPRPRQTAPGEPRPGVARPGVPGPRRTAPREPRPRQTAPGDAAPGVARPRVPRPRLPVPDAARPRLALRLEDGDRGRGERRAHDVLLTRAGDDVR